MQDAAASCAAKRVKIANDKAEAKQAVRERRHAVLDFVEALLSECPHITYDRKPDDTGMTFRNTVSKREYGNALGGSLNFNGYEDVVIYLSMWRNEGGGLYILRDRSTEKADIAVLLGRIV